MIKLILTGGGVGSATQEEKMKEEIKRLLRQDKASLLVVPFARRKEDWKDTYHKYMDRYADLGGSSGFMCADEQKDVFLTQIKKADIIFFSGGNEELLKEMMKDIPFTNFEKKIIVTSSAGTNIFSSKYYSNDRERIEEGLYKLPWNTLCHFDEAKNSKAYENLKELGDGKSTFALREGDFNICSVDIYGKEESGS